MTDPVTSSLPLRLVAFDPGKTTGVADWTQEGGLATNELTVPEVYQCLEDMARDTRGFETRIVSESFVITVNTAKNTQAAWSLNLIGVFQYFSWSYGWPLTMQSPTVAKTFATDAKLRHVGWWTKGRGGHANDASRHLMTYAAQRGLVFDRQTMIELADV